MSSLAFDDAHLNADHIDWRVVHNLALAADLAYSATAEAHVADRWGGAAENFRARDTQGFIAWFETAAILAFRGTQEPRDWLANLDLVPSHYDPFDALVHSGFAGAWTAVAPTVQARLADLGQRRLWITGHSLGGAVATFAACAHRENLAGLATFGQPRMLMGGAVAAVNGCLGRDYVRLVHDNDIVPKIPPGFSHAGQLSHFDKTGKQINRSGPLEVSQRFDSAGPEELDERSFEKFQQDLDRSRSALEGNRIGITAHRMAAYIELTQRKAAK